MKTEEWYINYIVCVKVNENEPYYYRIFNAKNKVRVRNYCRKNGILIIGDIKEASLSDMKTYAPWNVTNL